MRRNHVWMPAIVVRDEVHPRSYIVKQSGTEYRRNRRDILQTAEVVPQDDDPIDDPIVDAPPAPLYRSVSFQSLNRLFHAKQRQNPYLGRFRLLPRASRATVEKSVVSPGSSLGIPSSHPWDSLGILTAHA